VADLDELAEAPHDEAPHDEAPHDEAPHDEPAASEAPASEPAASEPKATAAPRGEVVADQASPAEPTVPLWRRRPSRWAAQVAALSIALIVLLAVSGLLFHHNRTNPTDAARQGAVNAAEAMALELGTIGAGNAAARMESLAKRSTGEFHDQLGGYSPIFQKILRLGNVSSRGSVTAAGIERLDADSATVLVTLSATVTNSQLPAGQLRGYRLAVRLERSGGQWLTSKVDYVG